MVLDYFLSKKGVIAYETIQRPESQDIATEKDFFFLSHHFYCSLKDSVISDKEYQAVKKFHKLLNLGNLGQLNKLYNFEDTKILTETFEQRSNRL